MCLNIGAQLVALFGKLVELLGNGALPKEVGHRAALRF